MRRQLISLTVATQLLFFGCASIALDETRTETYSTLDAGEIGGETYVVNATKEKIDALPDWYFGEGEPQISVDGAFRLAKEKFKEITQRHEAFTDISLYMRAISLGSEIRIVYTISFVEPNSVSSTEQSFDEEWTTPNQIQVWVGTDGTIFDTIKGPHENIIY